MFLNIASNDSLSSLSAVKPEDVQPNAVDIRLSRVWRFCDDGVFVISESGKDHAEKEEIQPNEDGFFELDQGTYEVQFEGIVSIGEGETGWVITRSTLNRNGVFITSGLYDSGYTGAMAGVMHVVAVPAFIQKGTRVGQFLIAKAQALHSYDGSYGLDASGKPKASEAVYHNKS